MESEANFEGLRNLEGPPSPTARRSDFAPVAEDVRVEGRTDAHELADGEGKLLAESSYLIMDAEFPGYKMRLGHRMVIFLIFDGSQWKSRSFQAYRYSDGCWGQERRLKVGFAENLTSLEAPLIKLSDEDVE